MDIVNYYYPLTVLVGLQQYVRSLWSLGRLIAKS
jgi:hypothetical protein